MIKVSLSRESLLKGKLSTVDLLGINLSELSMLLVYFSLFLNEEVNRTEHFPSVRAPWFKLIS
jgi:hypothetical protein